MKTLGENAALRRLKKINGEFRSEIAEYERRARDCSICVTPGACCLDEHFVNVRISRLEAVAIGQTLAKLPLGHQTAISAKVDAAIARYSLNSPTDQPSFFACPLYEKGTGCLVHNDGKPLPCIQHACYEKAADLPPDDLLDAAEEWVDGLNRRTYRTPQPFLPLPLAVRLFGRLR